MTLDLQPSTIRGIKEAAAKIRENIDDEDAAALAKGIVLYLDVHLKIREQSRISEVKP